MKKIKSLFGSDKSMDTFEYTKDNVLKVTRNPFGFETNMEKGKYAGVTTLKKKEARAKKVVKHMF